MARLLIILLFLSAAGQAQVMRAASGSYSRTGEEGPYYARILIDLGANGVSGSNGSAGAVDGVRTPNNDAGTTGQAGDGRWWNNREDFRAGTWISNPVDTANNTVTGFSISSNVRPSGSFGSNDYSVNTGGTVSAVGDYPATAVRDNCYWHTSGDANLTFVIPEGKKARIKFWGNRNDATARVLQFKLAEDGSWGPEYNAANNTTYGTAAVFTDITGTQVINVRVKSGSTFGHLSVIDIILEDDEP